MPVNRRELLSKLDKMIAAEQLAQPPGIVGSLVQDLETISEEGEEETLFQTPSPDLLSISEEGFSIPS